MVAAGLVAAAACGGGADGEGTGAGTTTAAAAGTGAGTGAATTTTTTTTTTTVAPPAGTEVVPIGSANHLQGPIAYDRTPPAGGDHAPAWQNCGFYGQPISTEAAVHSMEHGAVWITFAPDLPAAQVDRLRQLARQTYVLVSPWPGDDLPAPVVASAWGRQLRLDSADDPRLDAFVRAFRAGPQTPEPGAPCAGAIGTPE
jgi:hypothetical protein